MLSKAKILKGYTLGSLDGEIGQVKEFYFDDQHWTIRYLVADTGNWLTGRQVLISPYALVAVSQEEQHITIDLTKKQIEDSLYRHYNRRRWMMVSRICVNCQDLPDIALPF